jgi:hypothetical protein
MPLTYQTYYLIDSTGIYFASCSCDMPPAALASGTDQVYNPPYRNLPGTNNVTETGDNAYLAASPLAGGTPLIVTPGVTLTILADDEAMFPFRQDEPFEQNFWIFTDSLGQKCGQFSFSQYPSWSNTPPAGCPVIPPTPSPH